MALTESEQKRLQRIENQLAEMRLAISNLAAKRQLNHVTTLVQKELDQLRTQVASLQSQLDAIKN